MQSMYSIIPSDISMKINDDLELNQRFESPEIFRKSAYHSAVRAERQVCVFGDSRALWGKLSVTGKVAPRARTFFPRLPVAHRNADTASGVLNVWVAGPNSRIVGWKQGCRTWLEYMKVAIDFHRFESEID